MLLRLSVSDDGGVPLRLGMRDGNTSDRSETPVAIEECLALDLHGVHGIVGDSKAYSRRTLGLCREQGVGLVTLVPRTCTVRQALEAWGAQQPAQPLLVAKPRRTQDNACRQWHDQSVTRAVEVEDSDGRVRQEDGRFLVVHASQLALQHTQTYARAQAKEAADLTAHSQRVPTRWVACEADAAAASAEYAYHEPGRRGRHPQQWRYHVVRYRGVADTRRTRRARRGRPAKMDPLPLEAGYRLVVDAEALTHPDAAAGWYWPRPCLLRCVAMPTFFKPIKTKILWYNLGFIGSRIRRPSRRCGWRSPNGSRRSRC